jgi:putative phosphoribosyl transferase
MIFADRQDAARQLVTALAAYRGRNPLVLAIPRGAVPIGALIAQALEGELDVVLAHKLSSPWNAEYAVGAIDEQGRCLITDPDAAAGSWLVREQGRRLEEMQQRRRLYSPDGARGAVQGRVVIVVDDGLATGATMMAALQCVRAAQPARLVCAVPVAALESLNKVRELADEVVCLDAPPDFRAVGQYYMRFGQVEDEEVVSGLAQDRARRAASGA